MQSALTYHLNLLQILNNWIYELNQKILCEFDNETLIKNYIFEYTMYSDIFYLDKTKKSILTLYNIELLKTILPTLSYTEKQKILQNCNRNIELLTYDVLALLNIFKHFQENSEAKKYVLTHGKDFDNKLYVFTEYFQTRNFFLQNYFEVKTIVNNNGT